MLDSMGSLWLATTADAHTELHLLAYHPAKILVTAGAVKQCLSKNRSSDVARVRITHFASSSGKGTCQLTLKQKLQAWEL